MLADLVKAGKLPAIDQRLPADPRVRQVPKVGKYGGTLFDQLGQLHGHFGIRGSHLPYCLEPNNTGTETYPDACSKIEVSADKTEATFYFRKGIKFSDGKPFTADDILWWWENEQLNTDIYPQGPVSSFVVGGKPMQVTKVDANTVKLAFSKPYRPIINMAASTIMCPGIYFGQPTEYMKQYHIKFNPDANTVAKKYGFDTWFQCYNKFRGETPPDFGKPVLGPWGKVNATTDHEEWERNPYFYEVDQEGNQLPYIDKWYVALVPDAKMQVTKAAAGDVSLYYGSLGDIDALKAGAAKGGYKILDWKNSNPAVAQLAFNLNHQDPVLRKIYNDVRFRQAMSLAINRHEINTTLYFGQAREVQSTINFAASYYKDEWGKAFAEYNVQKANDLLDQMGLKWDADRKFRLRPDGKKLETILTRADTGDTPPAVLEMVKGYWDAVGNATTLLNVARALRDERGKAAQLDCTTWNTDRTEEIACYLPWATKFQPQTEMYYAVNWWNWYVTGGKQGEEPPQAWKDQFARMEKWYSCTTDEEYKKLGQEVWGFFSDQVVCIGTVGYPPMPTLVKNGLMNVPEFMWKGFGTGHSKSHGFPGFYWDKV